MTLKEGKGEFAAKFISARGKRKALALREMDLLAELDYERILYFHDAFEKKNVVILITELYPSTRYYTQVPKQIFSKSEKCYHFLLFFQICIFF